MKLDSRAVELLESIRGSPDDDAPRLVFADHIADHWPAHAAWIVAQCSGNEDPALAAAFAAEVPAFFRNMGTRRGFVEWLMWSVEARDLMKLESDDLFRLGPRVDKINLRSVGPLADLDAIVARLARFSKVSITANLDGDYARVFAAHAGLAHLRSLGISSSRLDEVVAAIIETTSFIALEQLALDSVQRISPDVLRTIARATFVRSLRALDLSGQYIEGLVDVLRGLPDLRELGAGGTPIEADFATLPHRFERLSLNSSQLDDRVAASIADAGIVSQLVLLDGTANRWSSQGFAYFIDRCGPLREIVAGERHWLPGAHVAAALGRHHDSLERLRLYDGLGAEGLRAFAGYDFPRLRELTLVDERLGDGLVALASAPFFPQLRSLFLHGSAVTLEAAGALAKTIGGRTELSMSGGLSKQAHAVLHERMGSRLRAAGY